MTRQKKTKRNLWKWIFFLFAVFAGAVLMAYPFVANYVFEHRTDSVIKTYDAQAAAENSAETEQMLAAAREYNQTLAQGHVTLQDPFEEDTEGEAMGDYLSLLSMDDSGVMGYVEIPAIGVLLPVYHGTAAETLEKGVGHLEGTSLPVGGEGTHCVLTGHTGLSSAKLFTDLTELEEGDIFIIRVLDQKLAYQVDQIKVVDPSELSDLSIEQGKDYCTLVTCTPYGVNTHRLLVRGVRTEYDEEAVESTASSPKEKSQWMQQYKKALLFALLLIAAAVTGLAFFRKTDRRRRNSFLRTLLGTLIVAAGILFYLYPNIQEWRLDRRTEAAIQEFDHTYRNGGDEKAAETAAETQTSVDTEGTGGVQDTSMMFTELYREMKDYNESLVKNGQELLDAWDYEQTPVDLEALGTGDGAVGYIEIPDMDVKLPLYIGATEANMAAGAAVMGETSMPIGGESTNSVIVGHRGYGGAPYFRDIENLKEGSLVHITNPWETLTYQVTEIRIIDPHDAEPILIRQGKDMVTLLTCHPYMSHGKYRYAVYCERVSGEDQESGGISAASAGMAEETSTVEKSSETGISSAAEDSSQRLIRYEKAARRTAPFLVLLAAAVLILRRYRAEKGKSYEK